LETWTLFGVKIIFVLKSIISGEIWGYRVKPGMTKKK